MDQISEGRKEPCKENAGSKIRKDRGLTGRGRRKSALWAYLAGSFFLVLALVCAFFLPKQYSRWQDEQLLGRVNLDEQQQVQLPQAHTVVAEKMEKWVNRMDFMPEEVTVPTAEVEELLRSQVEEWIKFGLLPEVFLDEYDDGQIKKIYLWSDTEEEGHIYWIKREAEEAGSEMDFVMETDGSCLYYASCILNLPDEIESGRTRWYHDGDWEWDQWKSTDLEEGGSFRAKEYCQAEYSRLAYMFDEGLGVVELMYRDFTTTACRTRVFVEWSDREKEEYDSYSNAAQDRQGFAVFLGGETAWELVREMNLEVWMEMLMR